MEFKKSIVVVDHILKQYKICRDIRHIIFKLIRNYHKNHHCYICYSMTPIEYTKTCSEECYTDRYYSNKCTNNNKIICKYCIDNEPNKCDWCGGYICEKCPEIGLECDEKCGYFQPSYHNTCFERKLKKANYWLSDSEIEESKKCYDGHSINIVRYNMDNNLLK